METRLPDELASVALNANSSLEYPAVFAGKERRVSLSGEGYFEVNADTEHLFIVRAGDTDVRPRGQYSMSMLIPDVLRSDTA